MLRTLFFILGLGLPLHGAVSVFGPDLLRWWKEGVLMAVLWVLCMKAWPERARLLSDIKNYELRIINLVKEPVIWAFFFLAWLEILVWLKGDLVTALTAARYLGLGFVVFLAVWGIWVLFSAKDSQKVFHKFSTGFITGSVLSVLFGLWAQFLGGFKVLEQWYSTTISSWVPGQAIPLYHQTSEGVIRMQGMASGPIEFSHLGVLGLWLVNSRWLMVNGFIRWSVNLLLALGILLSGSRAAILGALILLGWFLVKKPPTRWRVFDKSWAVNALLILVVAIAGLSGLKYVVSELPDSHLQSVVRLSDSDHITRPIEAFKIGMSSPILGNLGELGPAARAYNLKHHDTDQAPIAENVFVDYFAQLGLLGILLACGFWVSWFFRMRSSVDWLVLGAIMVLLMNLATILDMTPIAISWFAVLSFAITLPEKT